MFDGFGMLLKFDINGASNTVTSSHRCRQARSKPDGAAGMGVAGPCQRQQATCGPPLSRKER